jgi:hypothetical protein
MSQTLALADVEVRDHGTLIGLCANSDAAKEWMTDNLPPDAPRLGSIVYAEPRYADIIIQGMQDDGFTVRLG